MESPKNKFIYILTIFYFGFVLIQFTGCLGVKKSTLLVHNDPMYEDPLFYMVQLDDSMVMELVPVKFPENTIRFIQCCNQDTIKHMPIASYIERLSLLTKKEQLEEGRLYDQLEKRLKKKRRKLYRFIKNRSTELLGKNLPVTICDCVIDDSLVQFNKLRLIRSLD